MITFQETITLEQVNCGRCGGTYALNSRYLNQRREQGGAWHCPYCEVSWGYVKSENARLKSEIEEKERQIREAKCAILAEQQRRELAEIEAAKSAKKLRRVDKGVCPCCNRTFNNLQRHMETKHSTPTKK